MTAYIKRTIARLRHQTMLVLSGLTVVTMVAPSGVLALNQHQKEIFDLGINYYEPTDDACGTEASTTTVGAKPGPVYLIGDSVAAQSQSDIEAKFNNGWSITVNAKSGRFPHEAPAILDADKAVIEKANSVVIELGANVDRDFTKQLETIIAKVKDINDTARIFWVNIGSNTNGVGEDGTSLDGILLVDQQTVKAYSSLNKLIVDKSVTQGYQVINWFNEIFPDGDPTNIDAKLKDTKDYLENDKLHPTDTGSNALAGLIFSKVSAGQSNDTSLGTIDSLPSSVPEPYNSILSKAAAKFKTDVAALAVTMMIESGGFRDPPPPYGGGEPWARRAEPHLSSAYVWPDDGFKGSKGPFQFLYPTWKTNGVDGNNDGKTDVEDLTDASYGGAKLLSALGATQGTPFGDVNDPLGGSEKTLIKAWIAYNAGPGALDNASLNSVTANYIKKAAQLYPEIVSGVIIGAGISQSCTGNEGGLGVSPAGFVFPLKTTKEIIKAGMSTLIWCYEKQTNCHHDYNAADIFVPTGTTVVAARSGHVNGTKNQSGGSGSYAYIKGEDGNLYFYTHMGIDTLKVSPGQDVEAGDVLGQVGTAEDAQSTTPHLHFDILPSEYDARVSCSSESCVGYPFINVQPVLTAAYNYLPEK